PIGDTSGWRPALHFQNGKDGASAGAWPGGFGPRRFWLASNGSDDFIQQHFLGNRLPYKAEGPNRGSPRPELLRIATGHDDVFGAGMRVMAVQPFQHLEAIASEVGGSGS